jgi:translation elongation factor EF-Tu-like GTPase
MSWFRHKTEDSLDPQILLAKAQQADAGAGAASTFGVFRLTVGDVFSISGRGTVVTGRVEAGAIAKGSTVRLTRRDGSAHDVVVTGVEMFRKVVDTATVGDNVGLLLRGIDKNDVGPGDVLTG